jgi:hypothetical protein
MEVEATVPAYYVLSRALDDPQIEFIHHALRITPIAAVLITDAHDCELALKLSDEVYCSQTPHDLAQQIYKETGQSVIIIADTQLLDGYNSDGTKTPGYAATDTEL